METYKVSEKEPLDISKLPKNTILCTHCGKYLGVLIDTGKPMPENKCPHIYHTYCPCGYECFPVKLDNKAAVFTEDGYMVMDVKENDKITSIKLGKFK